MTNLNPLHILNLTSSLSIFQSCTVHIISNQIHTDAAQNYRLDPIYFPIVYSVHQYYPVKNNGHYRCIQNTNNNDKSYKIRRGQAEFKFRSAPNNRLTCAVNVIVDPLPCIRWERVRNAVTREASQVGGNAFVPLGDILPKSFFDPVYVFGISEGHYLYKSNWIWIYVEKYDRVSSFAILESSHSFFALEYELDLKERFPAIRPPKLLYRIEAEASTGTASTTIHSVSQIYSASYRKSLKLIFNLIQVQCDITNYARTKRNIYWSYCLNQALRAFSYMTLTPIDMNDHSNLMPFWSFIDEPAKDLVAFVFEAENPVFKGNGWMEPSSSEIITHTLISELLVNSSILFSQHVEAHLQTFPRVRVMSHIYHLFSFHHEDPFPLYFLTCTGLQIADGISIKDFVSAFHWKTWLTLFISALISGLFLNQIKSRRVRNDFFQDITFVYTLLLCQPCSSIKTWKWCFSPWILAALILSYSYQGENITRLCRSLKNSPIDSFDEILAHNFSIYSPGVRAVVERLKAMPRFMLELVSPAQQIFGAANIMGNGGVSISDALMTKLEMQLRKRLKHERVNNKNSVSSQVQNDMIKMVKAVKRLLVKPKNFVQAIDFSDPLYTLSQMKECRKQALVDSYDRIASMYARLYNLDGMVAEKLHISTKQFDNSFRLWQFQNFPVGGHNFARRLSILVHSGLVDLWVSQTKSNLSLDVRNALKQTKIAQSLWREPRKLSLKGNISVVFYMLLSFIAIPCVIFTLEISATIFGYFIHLSKLAWCGVRQISRMSCKLFICAIKLVRANDRIVTFT